MSLGAEILRRLCRNPASQDYPMHGIHYEMSKALERLSVVFPDLEQQIVGKSVIDFGCGYGYQLVALARKGAQRVIGIEVDERSLAEARAKVSEYGLQDKIEIESELRPEFQADIIVSQNSFEHFLNADEILAQMAQCLSPGGKIYVTFAPPWYAPWGAHMAFFCRIPWVNLLFPERSVMEVRALFRCDGAKTYRDAGLARMSVSEFERITRRSGLTPSYTQYDCVKGLGFLGHIPKARELFINRVSAILVRPAE
jgi:SAM-dependent methyltransferase